MTTFQSKVYECSRQNASVLLNDQKTEWINEFKEGIRLEKGDTIRILGSFVNEAAEGDQIEVTDTMSTNIIHTPYIRAHTLATSDTKEDLLDLGYFGSPAYSTDALGVEPPHQTYTLDIVDTHPTIDVSVDKRYQEPEGTQEQTGVFGDGVLHVKSQYEGFGTEAKLFGTNINTARNLALFSKTNVDNELYLAQQVKKFILPVFDGLSFENGISVNPDVLDSVYTPAMIAARHTLEDIQAVAPDTGAGRFSGAPRPGMMIATAMIGGTAGWFAPTGYSLFEKGGIRLQQYFGIPNLKGGVDSVVGKIIAVRPIKYPVLSFLADCFEIYVTDWINPATIKKDYYQYTLDQAHCTSVQLPTTPILTGNVLCRKAPHGAGQRENGYSANPSFNPINGQFMKYSMQPMVVNNGSGGGRGFNQQMNFGDTQSPQMSGGIRTGSDNSSTAADTEYRLGLGQNWGLSALWNGAHCAQMRVLEQNGGQRASSFCVWHRDPALQNGLDMRALFYDTDFQTSGGSGTFEQPDSEPHNFGAYIICNENCMMDIIKNGQDPWSETDGGSHQAGRRPRIWMEMGFNSHFLNTTENNLNRERHYVGNSFTTGSAATPATSNHWRNRFNYVMCGKPDNKNYILDSHDFGGTVPPAQPATGDSGCTAFSNQNTADVNMVSDGTPIYYSSSNGHRTWATSGTLNQANGTPFEWGGYNTCINSVYFQDKLTGNMELNQGNIIGRATVYQADVQGTQIHIEWDNAFNLQAIGGTGIIRTGSGDSYSIFLGNFVDQVFPLGGNQYRLILGYDVTATTIGDTFLIGQKQNAWYNACGTQAVPWTSDLLMIKEQITQVKVPPGYYTKEQLGARINDILHYNVNKYSKELGTKNDDGTYSIPSTVGVKERQFASEPTVINGNFLHSYIPTLTYGFTPVTADNANDMNLTASTKDMTSELLTYDWTGTYYKEDELPAHNGTTVRYVWEKDTNGIRWFGKHFKIYSPPYLPTEQQLGQQVHLIQLKGGSLVAGAFDATSGKWDINQAPRFSGWLEPIRTQRAQSVAVPSSNQGTSYTYTYRTRGVRNILSHGGSSRIFCGANNLSIEFNDLANRFNIFNMYTPIRPHASQNPSDPSFSIDDAVPSTIVNAKKTGDLDDSLTGIYISSLNGGAITQDEWGKQFGDNVIYDTLPNSEVIQRGQSFLEALGYNETQLSKYTGNGVVYNLYPYTFRNEIVFFGQMLRGNSKITPAINGANPFANDCLNIAPVQQYFIQTDSDDFFADDPPQLGSSPYYFIGSDLPINHFYGNDTGTKLPVIGINARNFHSFGFSFDLGASSIEYTIDRNITITSIQTAIYDSNLKTPTNISKFSSIIFLHTKNNYIKSLPDPVVQQILQQQVQKEMKNPMMYYQPAMAQYRTQPPVQVPQGYYQAHWNGSLNTINEDSDEDLE